jgi:hypothetical protein
MPKQGFVFENGGLVEVALLCSYQYINFVLHQEDNLTLPQGAVSVITFTSIDIYNMMGSRVGHIESVSVNGLLAIPEDLHEPASGMYTIVFRNRDKSDDEVVSKFIVAK